MRKNKKILLGHCAWTGGRVENKKRNEGRCMKLPFSLDCILGLVFSGRHLAWS